MGPEGLPRDWAQEAHHLAVAPHLLLDVKIDLVPNLHSVAKSAGSWVQEKIERDTAALNLHSFTHGMPLVHWSNIITSVHRPPQKPKRFRVDMAIEVISS